MTKHHEHPLGALAAAAMFCVAASLPLASPAATAATEGFVTNRIAAAATAATNYTDSAVAEKAGLRNPIFQDAIRISGADSFLALLNGQALGITGPLLYMANGMSGNVRTNFWAAIDGITWDRDNGRVSVLFPVVSSNDTFAVRSDISAAADAATNYTDNAVANAPHVPTSRKVNNKALATNIEIDQNDIFPASSTNRYIGVQGNAGRYIRMLAQTISGIIAGGYKVCASTLNDNNETTYMYDAVAVRRNGSSTDYYWDTSRSDGIVRRSEISSLPADLAAAAAAATNYTDTATNTLDQAYSPRVDALEAHGRVMLVGLASAPEVYFVFPGGSTLPTEGDRTRITSLTNTSAPYTPDVLRVSSGSLDVWGAGGTFLVNTKNDDEGVWIESRDGSMIITGTITASTASTFDASFKADPYSWAGMAFGGCRLVLATRGGLDKNEGYGVVIARRDITLEIQ